jgi:Transposase and inactivated derivatives
MICTALSCQQVQFTAITDQLIPELEAWQQRPLNSVYPIVWMDAIHYKVREEGRYISKAIYTLLGLTVEGKKEILGIYLSDNESASYLVKRSNRAFKIVALRIF